MPIEGTVSRQFQRSTFSDGRRRLRRKPESVQAVVPIPLLDRADKAANLFGEALETAGSDRRELILLAQAAWSAYHVAYVPDPKVISLGATLQSKFQQLQALLTKRFNIASEAEVAFLERLKRAITTLQRSGAQAAEAELG